MEQLGIQPVLLITQIINFAILVFVLKKLLYKPVITMLDKRKKEIEESVVAAEKMKREEEMFAQKQQKMMEIAKKDAQALLEKAKKEAKDQAKDLLADAQKQAQTLITKKKEEIDAEFSEKEKQLRVQAVDIAKLMVEQLLPEVMSTEAHRKVVERELKQLERVKLRA